MGFALKRSMRLSEGGKSLKTMNGCSILASGQVYIERGLSVRRNIVTRFSVFNKTRCLWRV